MQAWYMVVQWLHLKVWIDMGSLGKNITHTCLDHVLPWFTNVLCLIEPPNNIKCVQI